MTDPGSQLSSPFSTGGGGTHFETHVQAAFAVLMLVGGFAPCLPASPIKKIKLQGRYLGYNTDDFIAFVGVPGESRESKLLAQIKHSLAFTEKDRTFRDVIRAAWCDFHNQELFDKRSDAIALITGPLSASDCESVRTILEWARASADANDFITKVEMAQFSSDAKRAKLKAFRAHLDAAGGAHVGDHEVWEFLKRFHLLGYDLDVKAAVTLSLLHSLIGQYSPGRVVDLWGRCVSEVMAANQNAGTLQIDQMPDDLLRAFERRAIRVIPEELVAPTPVIGTSEIAIALLAGKWDESFDEDRRAIEKLSGRPYAEWIDKLREVLLQPSSPLKCVNGRWETPKRLHLWDNLGPRISNDDLDRLRQVVVEVLRERDPRFELPTEQRYAAGVYGKVLSHSFSLRSGLAEAMALLGNYPKALKSCSLHKAEDTARLAIRGILEGADWVLWASLNDVLTLLAEAAPREFLDRVNQALRSDPCPFDEVFAQEGTGLTGGSYMTGLLWALETLAWDSEFFSSAVAALGELAARDPGGQAGNRPANSLTTILLPWLPQTCAPAEKRGAAVKTLLDELPTVGWKLLLGLLPRSQSTSFGSQKPVWRKSIPDSWTEKPTGEEYRAQITAYAEMAIDSAGKDIPRLVELVKRLDDLPAPAAEGLLAYLESDIITSMPQIDRFPLWSELLDLVTRHRKFADARWALKSEQVERIAALADRLAPQTPAIRHQRLFSGRDRDLYEEKDDYADQRRKLEERRQRAIAEIAEIGGVQSVLAFASSAQAPRLVGVAFGSVAKDDADGVVLPRLLAAEEKALAHFADGFVWGRFQNRGWQWVDRIATSQWVPEQIGQFLACLPFDPGVWERSAMLLGEDQSAYWVRTSANPYQTDAGLDGAVDQLIKYRRPHAAIQCLHATQERKQPLDSTRVVRALLAVGDSTEMAYAADRYGITELIKALQDDPQTNRDDLYRVEWAYLPLLDGHLEAIPESLERRLATDPASFCELIRLVFRSKRKDRPREEPTEEMRSIAGNAYRLLNDCRIPPGWREDGSFDGDALVSWLNVVKTECRESGHLEVAMSMVGHLLVHTPADPDGLWIHRCAAAVLNAKDADKMREGFGTELLNSRGVHFVDPTGKPELKLASKYRQQADEVENAGYQRLAVTMRGLAESYVREAERVIVEHREES